MRLFSCCCCYFFLALLLVPAVVNISLQRHFAVVCTWKFVSYTSSSLEQKWTDKASEWGKDPCRHTLEDAALFDAWIPEVEAYQRTRVAPVTTKSLFSLFVYRDVCSGVDVSVPIEPFAGTGRHPGTCLGEKDIASKDYLLVETRMPPHRRAFFFDLGASLWNEGGGGASQSWVYKTYTQRRGVEFDGIYAWESTVHHPAKVFREVPSDVHAAYHWFNIAADATPGVGTNPLTILQRVAQPEDFVVLKLDIDNSAVEMPFISQILTNRNVSVLIDELFFEHHYDMQPMVKYGWKKSGSDSKMTMVDSARIFLGMRNLGIRAHVWV
jgi:hypothetical protein